MSSRRTLRHARISVMAMKIMPEPDRHGIIRFQRENLKEEQLKQIAQMVKDKHLEQIDPDTYRISVPKSEPPHPVSRPFAAATALNTGHPLLALFPPPLIVRRFLKGSCVTPAG